MGGRERVLPVSGAQASSSGPCRIGGPSVLSCPASMIGIPGLDRRVRVRPSEGVACPLLLPSPAGSLLARSCRPRPAQHMHYIPESPPGNITCLYLAPFLVLGHLPGPSGPGERIQEGSKPSYGSRGACTAPPWAKKPTPGTLSLPFQPWAVGVFSRG